MSRVLSYNAKQWEIPLLMNGRKTVARRIAKGIYPFSEYGGFATSIKGEMTGPISMENVVKLKCKYQPGDILYVRETWQHLYELDGNDQIIEDTGKYYYAASDVLPDALPFNMYVDSMGAIHENIPWRPSIHMPKEAARIWLKVMEVRVECLQDITEEQAQTEGFSGRDEFINTFLKMYPECTKESWVWVIEFERCEKPELLEGGAANEESIICGDC